MRSNFLFNRLEQEAGFILGHETIRFPFIINVRQVLRWRISMRPQRES